MSKTQKKALELLDKLGFATMDAFVLRGIARTAVDALVAKGEFTVSKTGVYRINKGCTK